MIAITWTNLLPGWSYKYIEDLLVVATVFDKSKLPSGELLKRPRELQGNNPSRMYRENTCPWAKKMTELFCSSMHWSDSFGDHPVWIAFRSCWETILKDLEEDEFSLYRSYISLFFQENATKEDFVSTQQKLIEKNFAPKEEKKAAQEKEKKAARKKGKKSAQKKEKKVAKEKDLSNRTELKEVHSPAFFYERQRYSLSELLQTFSHEEKDEAEIFLDQLASLSVIACLWDLWAHPQNSKYRDANKNLALLSRVLFPKQQPGEDTQYSGEEIPTLPRSLHERSVLGDQSRPAFSQENGYYILNAEHNEAVHQIDKTAPEHGWTRCFAADSQALAAKLLSTHLAHQRILLVSDDLEKNLRDALAVLTIIRQSIGNRSLGLTRESWANTELFIRCDEQASAPVLDTALHYFPEHETPSIRIHLIDDAKRTASELFSRHPMFYPLTRLSKPARGRQTVHLVILSDHPDRRYAHWLIREAFWSLPRLDENIQTKITVLSPHSEELCEEICLECPEFEKMSSSGKDAQKVMKPPFPLISYRTVSLHETKLRAVLSEICKSYDFLYFAVDGSSDFNSLSLGVKVREQLIRYCVSRGNIDSRQMNAVVAVHIRDADISDLSRDLMVPNVSGDLSWYNSYRLIPFGSCAALYSWDQLTGGPIEDTARCMHLQYCGADPDRETECATWSRDFFMNLYNHDSSFAAACSLPYRLFEAGIYPEKWDILDPDGWWNNKILDDLAQQLEQKLRCDGKADLTKHLAEYEHLRWSAFEMSRGWSWMSAKDSVKCILKGSPRHTLQVARLHPCLCDWKELERLSADYEDAEILGSFPSAEKDAAIQNLVKKKFQETDLSNIQATPEILRKKWLVHERTQVLTKERSRSHTHSQMR